MRDRFIIFHFSDLLIYIFNVPVLLRYDSIGLHLSLHVTQFILFVPQTFFSENFFLSKICLDVKMHLQLYSRVNFPFRMEFPVCISYDLPFILLRF